MSSNEEKKHKKIGLIVSGGIHLGLLILFFFMLAWKEPFPPQPEYGIELNFGLDQTGTGEIQQETPPQPVQQQVEEQPEETTTEAVEQQIESQPEKVQEIAPEEVVTQPDESPVVEEVKVEKPKEKPKPVLEEDTKPQVNAEEAKEKPVEKPAEKPNESAAQPNSQGDNANAPGDKGDPQGTIDSRALYGSQGGGDGASLDMAGWIWDFKPKPNDQSSESGRIVFQVKIDDQGEILSVITLEKTVSPTVEKVYRQAVEQLTFSRTADNSIPAPISTGTITFIIKSR
ncbi:MAG: hypothetical protein ACNS62_03775 [Candidatus Cyclobacteriaceae bacterium M3_2C_046]